MTGYGLTSSLNEYYRLHAAIYDWTRWAFLFGRTQLIELVALKNRPRRVLEIGCGTGANLVHIARAFPDAEIVGLDLSAEMLSKAQSKLAPFGPRVSLIQRSYSQPVSGEAPFDLIVVSYCLSMMNPGYSDAIRICRKDLSPTGMLAIVDFHDTPASWFRSWMLINHARLDGQILEALQQSEFRIESCTVNQAYGGLWRWFTCLAATP